MPASLSQSPIQNGHQREKRKKSSFSDLRIPRQDPKTSNLNFLALLLLLVGSPLPLSCKCCEVPEGTVSRRDGGMLQTGGGLWQPQDGPLYTTHSTSATWSVKYWEKTYLQIIPIEYPCIQIYPCRFLALRCHTVVSKSLAYQENPILKVYMWITCTF